MTQTGSYRSLRMALAAAGWCITTLFASWLPAQPAAPVTGQTTPPGVVDPNPALLYWQALALLPDMRPSQTKVVNDVLAGSLPATDGSVTALLSAARKGLDRFARAASGGQPCVWGITLDEGPFTPLPHMAKLQALSRLALVQAEAYYAADEPEKAWQWTWYVHRAARHVSAEPLLISVISQHALEQQALRLTARHALGMEVEWAARIARDLNALPPLHSVKEALTREHAMADWLRLMVMGLQHTPENEREMLKAVEEHFRTQLDAAGGAHAATARRTLDSVDEWKQLSADTKKLQNRTMQASGMPWPEYQKTMVEVRASVATSNPVLRNTLPAFEGAMYKQTETQTLTRMLQAVLTFPETGHQDGEMPGTVDAFDGKPFVLKRGDAEWTITAQINVGKRTLTLKVAR